MNCDHFTILKFRVYTIHSMIHQCKILELIIQNVFLENLNSHFEYSFKTFTVVQKWCLLLPVEVSNDFKLNLKRFHWFTILIFGVYMIPSMIHQWSILGLITFQVFHNYFISPLEWTFKTFTEPQIWWILAAVEVLIEWHLIWMSFDRFTILKFRFYTIL